MAKKIHKVFQKKYKKKAKMPTIGQNTPETVSAGVVDRGGGVFNRSIGGGSIN